MKKWTYLVATLFFGATVAFTSCVNTDEPEGIKEMRGAKAELLRAKALVEQAKATSEAAQATLTQAQAEVQKAIAEVQKAQAEAQRAQTQIEKDKAAAELKSLQAKAEAEIAAYEAQAAAQQLAYEKTMRDLEALALTLTTEELAAINSWKTFVDTANSKMQTAEGALKVAQNAYYNAVTDDAYISESVQEAKVAKAQLAADQKAKAYAITEEIVASLKEIVPTEWDEVLRDLTDSIAVAEVAVQEAKVAESEYYRSEEFQAYEQAVLAAIEAKGENEGVAGKFNNDRTYTEAVEGAQKTQWTGARAAYDAAAIALSEAAEAEIALEPYEFEVNPAVAYFLNHGTPNSGIPNSFKIKEGLTWSLGKYLEDVEKLADDEAYSGSDRMFKKLQKLMKYRDALDEFEIDPNGQEWLKLELPKYEKDKKEADSIYDAKVALWQIQANIVADGDYSGVDFAAYAEDLKELIDGQNAAYTAYAAGVAEYDSLVYDLADSVKAMHEAAIDAAIAADKQKALVYDFLNFGYKQLPESSGTIYSKGDWNNDAWRNTFTKQTGKDSLSMALVLNENHRRDESFPTAAQVLAMAKDNVDSTFVESTVKTLKTTKTSYWPQHFYPESGAVAFEVGGYTAIADAAVTTAKNNDKTALAKAIKKTNSKLKLINDATGDGSLLKAYLDYDGDAIKGASDGFATAMMNKYGLKTIDSLRTSANSFNYLVGYDQWAPADFANSAKAVKSKKTPANDSTIAVPAVGDYKIYTAVKKSISDEAFATMKEIAGIDDIKAKELLTEYSNAAFGSEYDWDDNKARLINEIEDKLLADCKGKPIDEHWDTNSLEFIGLGKQFEDKYGAFGAKYWYNYWFEVCSNYQVAADLKKADVDSLDAQIARMQAAVEAAKMPYAPLVAALDSAKADYEAADAAITAAKEERDAQMEAQEELVTLAKANVKEWKYQEANLAVAIGKIADGEETVEAYLNAEELDLAKAKVELEKANEAVVEAQKVLDMIKAGTYDYEFGVQQAESALNRAQDNYDIAAAEYQAALAKLAEVLATLVGE